MYVPQAQVHVLYTWQVHEHVYTTCTRRQYRTCVARVDMFDAWVLYTRVLYTGTGTTTTHTRYRTEHVCMYQQGHGYTAVVHDHVYIWTQYRTCVPLGLRILQYIDVAVVHRHVWRTVCSVCATGARVAPPVPCNSQFSFL